MFLHSYAAKTPGHGVMLSTEFETRHFMDFISNMGNKSATFVTRSVLLHANKCYQNDNITIYKSYEGFRLILYELPPCSSRMLHYCQQMVPSQFCHT